MRILKLRKFLLIIGIVYFHNFASAQETVSQQLWGNAVFGFPVNQNMYLELDAEPKWQISRGERWRNIDITPLIEYYPNSWLDLTAEVTGGYTNQSNDVNTVEITPRLGIRFHLFTNVWQYFETSERLPLSRLTLATFFRLEARNLWYSGDLPSEHESRLRMRLESKIAINHERLDFDDTVYLFTDVEYYVPLGREISEKFASKFRLRIGPGYRLSYDNRFELLLIYDFARDTLDEAVNKDALAVDLRFKFYFN
jgi:hypothetical protein